jgi:hypothetical protein
MLPIKAHRGRFFLESMGAGEGWEGTWHAIKERLALLFALLRHLPSLPDLSRVADGLIAKDMRMSPDQLVDNCRNALTQGKVVLLSSNTALKDDMQQQIAKFFLEGLLITGFNAFDNLVRFL